MKQSGTRLKFLLRGTDVFNVATAVRIGRALEDYDITWYRGSRFRLKTLTLWREVKNRIRVPVAAGERIYSRWDYQRFLQVELC